MLILLSLNRQFLIHSDMYSFFASKKMQPFGKITNNKINLNLNT